MFSQKSELVPKQLANHIKKKENTLQLMSRKKIVNIA